VHSQCEPIYTPPPNIVSMDRENLRSLLIEQNEEIKTRDQGYEREVLSDIESKIDLKHILVITGPRRAGKSTLLVQMMNNYLDQDSFYYLNFDDERLIDFTVEDFNRLYELFIEEYGERDILIFDEIQNIENWEMFVTRMYENGKKLIITGSNAKMLSQELSTRLTGRYIDVELYPFSFIEFLRAKDVEIKDKDVHITEKRAVIRNLFDEYLKTGGFPENVVYDEPEILQNLYKGIVTKDIITRHNIKKQKTFREIALHLLSNISKPFTYNSIKNNYGINSVHTAKNYVEHLEESFLMFELSRYSPSFKKQRTRPKKIYCVDTGIPHSVSFRFSEDLGRTLENAVFIELKRRGSELYYHKDKKECDFLVRDGTEITDAIQVTTNLKKDNEEREVGGLIEACEKYSLEEGLILTMDEESEFEKNGKKIKVYPIWKWFLRV